MFNTRFDYCILPPISHPLFQFIVCPPLLVCFVIAQARTEKSGNSGAVGLFSVFVRGNVKITQSLIVRLLKTLMDNIFL